MTTSPTSPLSPTLSPLTEADPKSLDRVFAMDPLDLQDKDIDMTIDYLRKARATFLSSEAAGKVSKTAGA